MSDILQKAIFSHKRPKVIEKTLLINGGDLDLYLDLFLTDKDGKTEKILTKKADSILANFMRILYLQMGRDNRDNAMAGTFYYLDRTYTGASISSITSGTGSVFRITITGSSPLSTLPAAGKVTLGGFQGITLDGRYNYTKVSNSAIDIDGTSYSAGWTTGTGNLALYAPTTNLGSPHRGSFSNQGIIVGTGDAPVEIDDQLLEKQIPNTNINGGLVYSTSTVAQDTNDSTSAQITMTRAFANNSSLTVAVKEIGYLMQAGSTTRTILTMRDILPVVVNVATGATLTVNYRIKTVFNTGTDPGGFLASFMRLLYRQIQQTTRAIFDVDNVSRTTYASASAFGAVKSGGLNVQIPGNGEYQPGYRFGIVLGMGNSSVAMGDYYLETPIVHGNGTNEMLYYGGFSEEFEIGADYAQFKIMKAMENNSGSAIEIKEYILTGASDANTSTSIDGDHDFVHLYTMTRNVLTTPVTIADQEIVKVIYTLRCIVGGSSS